MKKDKEYYLNELVDLGYEKERLISEKLTIPELKDLIKGTPEFTIRDDREAPERKPEEDFVPSIMSPEWQEFIMGKFTEDELIDGRPTIAGLRRLAYSNYAPGLMVRSQVIDFKVTHGDGYSPSVCTCNYLVEFDCAISNTFSSENYTSGIVSFGGIGHASSQNTDLKFSEYLPQVAETQAASRALRLALNIQTIAYDEIGVTNVGIKDEDEKLDTGLIGEVQIKAIAIVLKEQDLTEEILMGYSDENPLKLDKPISELSRIEARELLTKLHEEN